MFFHRTSGSVRWRRASRVSDRTAFFNLAASYRRTWINELGGEWRTDVQVGHTSRLWSELYQPLEISRTWFVAPSIEIERRDIDLFQGAHRIARYDVRSGLARVELGSALGRYGELRAGVAAGKVSASLDTGPPEFAPPQNRYSEGAITARAMTGSCGAGKRPPWANLAAIARSVVQGSPRTRRRPQPRYTVTASGRSS